MSLFVSLIKKISDIGEETEEQKLKRETENKLIDNQSNIISNMKCPICGYTKFDEGYISVSGSGAVAISKINTYHDDYNKEYENKVLVCNNCGYVLVFADFKTKKVIKI